MQIKGEFGIWIDQGVEKPIKKVLKRIKKD
jgi:hypothetical protein